MIDKVDLTQQQFEIKACTNKPKLNVQTNETSQIEKSIYDSKGSNVYFCGLVRGLSVAEEAIAENFRTFVDYGRRKFNEHDIKDLMDFVKKAKTKEDKEFIFDAVNGLLDPIVKQKVDDKIVRQVSNDYIDMNILKKTLSAIEGKSEDAKFAILDFADYEARHATNPMQTFTRLPKDTQDELTGILEQLQKIRMGTPMRGDGLSVETSDDLYDLFKVVMYAHEDLPKLNSAERQQYLLEQLDVIGGSIKYLQKSDNIESPEVRQQVVSFSKDLLYYFTNKFIVS